MAHHRLEFSKWHGIGNDYIIIAAAELDFELTPERVRLICDRHFGIGADGILLWDTSERAQFSLEIFNPDGSTAEMCGNGIRMLASHLYLSGEAPEPEFTVHTEAGIITPRVLEDHRVRVHMGKAKLGGANISGYEGVPGESEAVGERLNAGGDFYEFTFVDMGNPHCIIATADPGAVDLAAIGPAIERHEIFPNRTNVEFIRVDGPSEVTMRVWERGVGETNACGTGACAVAVAAARTQGASSPMTVHLSGGDLEIEVGEDLDVYMTGPAEEIYVGEMSRAFINRLEEL
ncbi:MAG: diaminopimelate epimerase [Gaiellales bacterium]|nr:MAG: diaminopimelate epimerase [Gaiellales bacterium]